MKELFIGQFRVDLDRGEIVHLQDTVTLEPKVLKVFLLLIERPNQIVTHQEILDKVWPDVVVEPNTLQRCIAQLRKSFKDDAKQQRIIATHPRVGYSLVADIDWKLKKGGNKKQKIVKHAGWFTSLLVIGLLLVGVYEGHLANSSSYTYVTPLTATDTIEYRPAISPNGQYVAFQRPSDNKANIWVKDLGNNNEYLMTSDSGHYSSHSWSPSGERLAFSLTENSNPVNPCDSVEVLAFTLAKSTPQKSSSILNCSERRIWEVTWLSNDSLAYVVDEKGKRRVEQLHIPSKKVTTLYQKEGENPELLAFSAANKKLAILQNNMAKLSSLLLLDTTTNKIETIPMHLADKFLHQGWSGLDWHPDKDILLAANKQSLFEVSVDGTYIEHPISTFQTIYDPVYHPDGYRVTATLGIIDMDAKEITWGAGKPSQDHTLHRSIVVDKSAKYQPRSKGVAFMSERSGRGQIWYDNGETLRQISQFAKQQWLQSFVWSKQGNLLALNVSGQLNLLSIDGELEAIKHDFKVLNIYQWVGDNKILLSIPKDDKTQLVLFDINNSTTEVLYEEPISWAQIDENNVVYIADYQGKLSFIKKDQANVTLNIGNVNVRNRFFIQAENIIFISDTGTAWMFNIASEIATKLSLPEHHLWQLDDIDIKNQRLSYSGFVDGRKEIVMFH